MPGLLSSPRRRRRLKWAAAGGAVVGAMLAAVLLVRQPPQPSIAPGKNAPKAQLVGKNNTHVSPTERRAIDSVLDRFVPAALSHKSMSTAWHLSGPELTGGTSLRQWVHGTSPIPYYPVGGKRFHGWTTIDAGPGYVTFNLIVHPRHGSKVKGAWVFSGQMIRHHSRWLVNRFYTIALLSPPTKSGRHEVGPADYAAAAPSTDNSPPPTGQGALGTGWLAAIGVVIGLVILFPIGLGIGSVVRGRRRRKQYERSRDRELPPLPPPARQH